MRHDYNPLRDDTGDPEAADSFADAGLDSGKRAAEINLMICLSICKMDQRAFNMHTGMMH